MATASSRDEVLYLRAAGLDLGERLLLACLRSPGSQRAGTCATPCSPN